jgi:hypothetical protein
LKEIVSFIRKFIKRTIKIELKENAMIESESDRAREREKISKGGKILI